MEKYKLYGFTAEEIKIMESYEESELETKAYTIYSIWLPPDNMVVA